jgi:hypothetical protein
MKNISLLTVVLLMSVNVFSQKLPGEQVEVLAKFEAELAQTQKISTKPTLPAIENVQVNEAYTVPTRLLTLNYEPPSLKPLALNREKPEPAYKFYSKIGYGIPNQPFLDLHVGSGASNDLLYHVHAYHNSANNSQLQENQRFSSTSLKGDVIKYTENFAIGGELGYNHDVVHFYGYENILDSTLFAQDSVRQRYGLISGKLNLFNSEITKGDLNYDVGLDFYNLSDLYDGNELGVDVYLDFTKWIADAHSFKLKVGNDLTNFNGDTIRQLNNILYLQPNFTFHGGAFQFKIGANMANADSVFYVFPDVEAIVNLGSEKFAVIAGATGDLTKNSFRTVTDYNPFVFNQFEARNTSLQHYYGGLRGNFNGFSFEGLIGYKMYKNLAFYLNEVTDTKRFNVLYDNANSFNIHGSVSFKAIENLEVGGTIDVNTYTLDTLQAAWHLPNLEMNINAKYKLFKDKLVLRGELYSAGGISYLDANSDIANTGSLFDLNIGATFQAAEKLGIFLDLNNVTNQKFQRWNNYPNFGFNLIGGITLKF